MGLGVFLLPYLAVAQGPTTAPRANVTTFDQLIQFINRLAGWFAAIIIAISIFYILYAAYKYLTAAGDAEKIKEANHTLIYALVAVGVAILAYALPRLIGSLFGAQGVTY